MADKSRKKPGAKKLVRTSRAASLLPYEELSEITAKSIDSAARQLHSAGPDAQMEAWVALVRATADCMDQAEAMLRAATRMRVALIRSHLAYGMTMEDVGKIHGLTRQRIGQLLKQYPKEQA